jgi:hypothetical protein
LGEKTWQEFAAVRRHHPHEKVGVRFSAQYWVRKPGENMRRRGGIIHMEVGISFSAQYWVRKPGESSRRRGSIIHMRKWASGSLPSIG